MINPAHLLWIVIAAVLGFLVPFLFGDLRKLPLDWYYFIYFAAITAFFAIYIRQTGLNLKGWFSPRLIWGIILGLLFAALMAKNVFSQPETARLTGGTFVWVLFWRGLVYGAIDGLFLSVFPWIVTWRAFDVSSRSIGGKIVFMLLAWVFVLLLTTAYHAGFKDFRSKKMFQADIGNTLISLPTFLSANPIGAPITHAGMHIAAVIHSPQTDLFLPPHR